MVIAFEGAGWVTFTGSEPGKRLLQPLLQGRIEPALFGAFSGGLLELAPSRHGSSPAWYPPFPQIELRSAPTMLDDHQSRELKGTETLMKHITYPASRSARAAKRRVPKAFFRLPPIAAPMPSKRLRANRDDLQDIKFPPAHPGRRSKRDFLDHDPRREPAALPLILAPVGPARHAAWRRRDSCLPRGAGRGHSLTQSTMSICSIEDIAAPSDKTILVQLYVMKDRGFIKALIERAIAAKCSALVLTVDLQVIGQRHADIKNGMTVPPPEWSLSKLVDFRHQAGLGLRRVARQASHPSAISPAT